MQTDSLALARVDLLSEESDAPLETNADLCARILRKAIESGGEELVEPPLRYASATWVSARLAELLPLSPAARQRLLEMDDARDRIEILRRLISSARQ